MRDRLLFVLGIVAVTTATVIIGRFLPTWALLVITVLVGVGYVTLPATRKPPSDD